MAASPASDRAGPQDDASFDEAAARRVLLLKACETEPAGRAGIDLAAIWSPEDRVWASRLASETAGPAVPPARWLDERARHAMQRLLPRDRRLKAIVEQRIWRPAWPLVALFVGALLGLLTDGLNALGPLGQTQRINLLALPLAAVVAWNLAVYAWIAWTAVRPVRPARAAAPETSTARSPGALRRTVAKLLLGGKGPLPSFGIDWSQRSAPLTVARAALLLHLAAAALALGMVAGLYLRGLVLDFSAGWQSTFLDAPSVRMLLATLLAPASAATGIAVPDVAAIESLRVGDGLPNAAGHRSAAIWLHLFAATLGLFVVIPRLLLAAVAAMRAAVLAKRFPLALNEPYFQRLLQGRGAGHARIEVLPHGSAPSAQAALGLQRVLAAAFGEKLDLRIAPATAYGDEERAAIASTQAGGPLRIALFDLGATPEPETQGRFVDALLAAGSAPLVIADESSWRARFASMPERIAERRAAWARFAESRGLGFVAVALDAPDVPAATASIDAALHPASRPREAANLKPGR